MEIVQFAGLEIVLAQLNLVQGQRWSSRSDAGLWCSVILEGQIDVEGTSFGRRTWQGGASLRYYTDGPTDIDHTSPTTADLLGVFLRVPPEQIEAMFGPDMDVMQQRKPMDARTWEREPLIMSLGWQMLGCSLTASARRLYLSGKALELLSVMADGGSESKTKPAPSIVGVARGRSNKFTMRGRDCSPICKILQACQNWHWPSGSMRVVSVNCSSCISAPPSMRS